MMLDLNTIDSATVLASPELDALIDIEWMGNSQFVQGENLVPEHAGEHWEYGPDGEGLFYVGSAYSANPAFAGDARRKADYWGVKRWYGSDGREGVRADIDKVECFCAFDETHNDKGKAEALATCRAIVEALKAAEAEGGDA